MSQYIPRHRLVREYQNQKVRKQRKADAVAAKVKEAADLLAANEPPTALEQERTADTITDMVEKAYDRPVELPVIDAEPGRLAPLPVDPGT